MSGAVALEAKPAGPGAFAWSRRIALAIPVPVVASAVALAARCWYLFRVADPENAGRYTDLYHHWQIAYLTREIGLAQGRLWDLRGMEYWWGMGHPLLSVALFTITGSIDVVVLRLLSIAAGAAVVGLVFAICRRHWGLAPAVLAAGFAALSPIAISNDAAGAVDPLELSLILLGIWLWPRHAAGAGVAWAAALLFRADAWLFTPGLIVAALLGRERAGRVARIPLVAGFALPALLYMKVLLDATGNPIYPLYWNLVGVAQPMAELPPASPFTIDLFVALFVVAMAGLAAVLWWRPRGSLFLVFGFGATAFTFGVYALHGAWMPWAWMYKGFVWVYDFAAALLAIGIGLAARRLPGRPLRIAAAAAGALVLLVPVQYAWLPVQADYQGTEANWLFTVSTAEQMASLMREPADRQVAISLPASSDPSVTYALVRYGGLDARQIASQFYGPFYYLPAAYSYEDHRGTAGVLLQCALVSSRTRLLVTVAGETVPTQTAESRPAVYAAFVADHPDWFRPVMRVDGWGWTVYEAAVPDPGQAACTAARREAGL